MNLTPCAPLAQGIYDTNLKQDLTPLFLDQVFIANWLKNWRESYFRLLDDYKIHTIKGLNRIEIHQDSHTDNFSFVYWYKTEDSGSIRIIYTISDYWIVFQDVDLSINIDNKISDLVELADNFSRMASATQKKLKRYATLFYQKTEKYFKKTNHIMLGDSIVTKVIRMTADNLNQKEQIVLNKSALLSCELDDLLK
ncbi:MAG: hypothetical protein Q7K35_02535 [bacterium]|nr:hypothetical protein [bacterium]